LASPHLGASWPFGKRERYQVRALVATLPVPRPGSAGHRRTSFSSADFGSFVIASFRRNLIVARRKVIEK
jgi:hypothetical protein